MGPSGAGKDTLLSYARARLTGAPVLFAHRYITRAPSGDENFVSLDPREFAARLDAGLFAYHWEANGHRYGIGIEVERWRTDGRAVVVSGSRAHFAASLAERDDVTPVLVTAPPEILAARLAGRGREDEAAIAARLRRAAMDEIRHPRLLRVENAGTPAEAGDRLAALIRACAMEFV